MGGERLSAQKVRFYTKFIQGSIVGPWISVVTPSLISMTVPLGNRTYAGLMNPGGAWAALAIGKAARGEVGGVVFMACWCYMY
jgi:hypothetical protein